MIVIVVNCFWIYIFDKIPTGQSFCRAVAKLLWIAFEFISLTRFQQDPRNLKNYCYGCELLLNLYLWQDSNRLARFNAPKWFVVNCFWIYIFDKIPTGRFVLCLTFRWLWIAFEFISLTRFQQDKRSLTNNQNSCELLLNLYLWQDSNREIRNEYILLLLWIAFEFISLTRFQQDSNYPAVFFGSCELLLNLYLWQDSNRCVNILVCTA